MDPDMYLGEDGSSEGEQCLWNETCSGHGRCAGSEGVCECDEGWAGERCDACAEGLSGEACEQVAEAHVCLNDGWVSGDGSCECLEGFAGEVCGECEAGLTGQLCETACVAGVTCVHGHCSGEDESCVCDAGYAGDRCDECASGFGGECAAGCDAERDCGGVRQKRSCNSDVFLPFMCVSDLFEQYVL